MKMASASLSRLESAVNSTPSARAFSSSSSEISLNVAVSASMVAAPIPSGLRTPSFAEASADSATDHFEGT